MLFRFQLAVLASDDETLIPVEDYLHLNSSDIRSWTPDLELCGIFLEHENKELLVASEVWFGRLDILVTEFRETSERLSRGENSIIRSGDLGDLYPAFLLFEPLDNEEVLVSLFHVEDFTTRMEIPFDQNLYNYVDEHIEEIVQPDPDGIEFKRLSCSKLNLIESLNREASLGQKIYDLIGMRDGFEWWNSKVESVSTPSNF
jgi:hypothetical protein